MMLEKLTQCFGVSGRESKITKLVGELIKPYTDSITEDALGNLIAFKEGYGKNKKKIMCCAHIDEVGFAVTKIEDNGFLRVRNMGGVSAVISHCSRVRFENGVTGVMVVEGDVSQLKGNDITKLFIDIGAKSREDALNYVNIGDMACYIGEFMNLHNDRVVSKSFDNRANVYVLMETLMKLENQYNDIYGVFTVQEELGLRGATVVSERIRPDIGVVLDITNSFDIPSKNEGNPCMGKGAAIKVLDNSVVCDANLIDIMIALAEENDIPYQLDVEAIGGTDGGAINTSYQGVRTAGISIPIRYIHSPASVVDMNDVKACIDLLSKFCLHQFEI